MNNTMEYKGYVGSVEFSEEDGLFYGKVMGIRGFSALGYPVASRIDKILSKLCFGSLFFILFAAVPLPSYKITSNS